MGVIKRNGNTYGGGGGASADGKAESSAIAPVFDATATYAEGDRVMYQDELYVFNTAHTGAWDAADADKSDVDSEMPEKLTSQQMQAIKNAFVIDAPRNGYPVLFDETGAEHFVGWYKYADGTKKPEYRKDYIMSLKSISQNVPDYIVFDNTSNINDDIVTRMNGVIHIENANQNKDIEIGSYNAEGILSGLTKNNANGNLYITVLSTNYGVSYSAKISAFYTKTTDQPQ